MKLKSLKLERFGHFQGAALEFSDGLQLLYGRNEAGKSTLVAALRALLFKYPPGQYDFRFAESTLAVSARLQFSDGAEAEVRREKNKGWKGQLGGDKLSDDAFKDKLGRPSQELYANVFAFGLHELARGGESIAEAGLSTAMSSVGVGIGPDALLAELKKQADELYSDRASKKPINQLVAEIREQKKLLRESELRGERFLALEEALTANQARASALRSERETLLRRSNLVETALRVLPEKQSLAGALVALERLGPTVALPASAEGEYQRLMADRDRLAARLAELDGKLARARSELESLAEPEKVVADARLTALADAWSGHVQRKEQLEEALAERARLQAEKQRLRARLDPPWTDGDGPLPAPRVEEVRRHKGLLDGLSRKLEAAARDRDRAARELEQAAQQAEKQAGEAPSPEQLSRLRAERDALWEKVRKSWLEGALNDGEGSGALFVRSNNRLLATALTAATAAADGYADELRRRATDVAAAAEACARRDERARALAAAEAEQQQAAAALAAGERAWHELWQRCGFLPHSPDAMLEWLADHQSLLETAALLENAEGRAARLDTATRDYQASLRQTLGGEGSIDAIRRKLEEESSREQERIRVGEKRRHLVRTSDDLTHDQKQARAQLDTRLGELAAWRARAAAAPDDDDDGFLLAAGKAREAHELKQEIGRAERTLAEAQVAAADLDEALARGRELLAAEKSELAESRARLEAALQEADRAVGAADAELRPFDGRSQAIALQAQLEAKRAELRDRAGQWARLAAARSLLERQLQRFSARDQPRLLESVGKLFAAMTRGRYSRVLQRLDAERTFMAVRADGVEVEPQHLSTATREQLYLAVRLAYIDSYCARSEPLPLCLDDVLVNFDDERAAATLDVLAHFAAEGRVQVLLLTCHPHLIEVARKALPSLAPLELPAAS